MAVPKFFRNPAVIGGRINHGSILFTVLHEFSDTQPPLAAGPPIILFLITAVHVISREPIFSSIGQSLAAGSLRY